MTRALAAPALATLLAVAASPQSQIQNGRIERRASTGFARDVQTLVSGARDPVWIAWREPMVDGERSLCCWYSNEYEDSSGIRGCMVDSSIGGAPQLTAPAGPVPIEGGTGAVMMLRAVEGHVERLRLFSDDCQLDAGGRTVYWLDGVSPQESLKYLETLSDQGALNVDAQRALVNAAIRAIALHRDPGADAILDRIAAGDGETSVRRQAGNQLGSLRGAHGFDTLRRLVETEKQADLRRSFVTALGQTAQPRTPEVLLGLARDDTDAKVRGEAVYWYTRRTGAAGIPNVTAIIEKDADGGVRNRGVSGLASLPKDAGVPPLIALARTSPQPTVRKEAITALGRSKDPRAVAYLEELLRR